MNKTELLNKVAQTADERQLLARVWDKAEQAQRGVPAWTPFLSQSQQEAAPVYALFMRKVRCVCCGKTLEAPLQMNMGGMDSNLSTAIS